MSTTPTTSTCYRHRPDLAKHNSEPGFDLSLDTISSGDRAAITHVWSLFSSAPKKQRDLILKGILSVCCMPQLSFIYESLQPLLRIDFVSILPRHVNFKIFSYLDATSLCQAAQVSHAWKCIADDERLWYIMCDQHTGKTCVKCGWGLSNKLKTAISPPFLPTEKRPTILPQSSAVTKIEYTGTSSPSSSTSKKRKHSSVSGFFSQFPRKKQQAPLPSTSAVNDTANGNDQLLPANHWKSLYRERMIVEQNWRHNRFVQRELGGETQNGVICIQACDDLQVIMIGYDNNTIQVYDGEFNMKTGTQGGPRTTMVLASSPRCLQFDETKLIVGESDHSISIWDWHHGTRIRTLQGHHTGAVTALHFNDRNLLATGSTDHTIRLWDFAASQSFVLLGHQTPIRSLLLQQQQQQQLLVSSGDDKVIRIWDLTTRQCIRTLTGHNGGVLKVIPIPRPASLIYQTNEQFTGNNKHSLILSCSSDNTIKIWDIQTGECIRTMFGHMDHVTTLACDQFRIISGSKDRTLRIWSLNTGVCQHAVMLEHPVDTVALSSAGILSAFNGVGCIWDYSN